MRVDRHRGIAGVVAEGETGLAEVVDEVILRGEIEAEADQILDGGRAVDVASAAAGRARRARRQGPLTHAATASHVRVTRPFSTRSACGIALNFCRTMGKLVGASV